MNRTDTMNDTDNRGLWPPEEDVIFVPAEVYHGAYRAPGHMERVAGIIGEERNEIQYKQIEN